MESNINKEISDTYVILEEIGSGGGGTVYKAFHKRLKKEVALKKIHGNLKNINTRIETDILKNLKHSYLPQVIDFLELEDGTYTVMEYIDGVGLDKIVKSNEKLPEEEVVKWFKQLCQTLEVLHNGERPVIHGDIKPANIMITNNDDICLIDFNISSIFEGSKTIISGYTPGYASPEQIEFLRDSITSDGSSLKINKNVLKDGTVVTSSTSGGKTELDDGTELDTGNVDSAISHNTNNDYQTIVDVRTDIYNMGATVFHLLTGKKPVTKDKVYTSVRELNPDISPALAYIVDKCIALKRENRYENVTKVLDALNKLPFTKDRYQKLLKRQKISRALMIVGIFAFSLLAVFGYMLIGMEQKAKYTDFVNRAIEASSRMDEEDMDYAYEKAIGIDPFCADAYEVKGKYYYDLHRYDEALNFIEKTGLSYAGNSKGASNLYYIMARCLMDLDRNDEAVGYFEDALDIDNSNPLMYVDYAICEAKLGEYGKAKESLNYAIDKDFSDDYVTYLEGEINKEKGNTDKALKLFNKVFESTNDKELIFRASCSIADICEADNTEETLLQAYETCEAAEGRLDRIQSMTIREKKAQLLINLGVMTGNKKYDKKAIAVFNDVIDDGYDTFLTHTNIVELLYRDGMYDEEEDELNNMLKLYGEDYRIYKYFAYLEAARQKNEEEKDYSGFKEYYDKMMELIDDTNIKDLDVQKLSDMYKQMEKVL